MGRIANLGPVAANEDMQGFVDNGTRGVSAVWEPSPGLSGQPSSGRGNHSGTGDTQSGGDNRIVAVGGGTLSSASEEVHSDRVWMAEDREVRNPDGNGAETKEKNRKYGLRMIIALLAVFVLWMIVKRKK